VSHAFDAEDVGLVTAIANIAAVKVQTAQLAREQAESRRLQEEIRLAAEVQSRLLPRAVPPLRGWSLGTMSRPCHSMGGDYFDWELAGDGLRLAFADVAGKGTAAALLMAAVRALVRAHWGERDLAKAAETVSRAVFDSVPEGRYATAFLARLDPVGGQLHYVNAGHQPPILVRRNGDVELLESQGFPLGLVEATAYQSGLTTLAPGDTLLVFSDGVCEAKDGRGAELGPAALVAHARQALGLDAAALAATIERAIDAHSQGTPADDDRTLLVLRRTPPHARRP
jgi:sigma-B regulation protein RsbU (phosphoserine phosphatase)